MDLGLKYRFFNTKKLNFSESGGQVPFDLDGRFRSHSLLASLIYNFAPPLLRRRRRLRRPRRRLRRLLRRRRARMGR